METRSSRLSFTRLCALALGMPTCTLAGTLASLPLNIALPVPPTIMFALSVEFPTAISAAYYNASGYSTTREYLGYFDANKCYDYEVANGWFSPAAPASARRCASGTGRWSGNLLNWATMTGLDEFRHAMTGGNRVLDTAQLTVLERSFQSNQGAEGSNYPIKTFTDSDGRATPHGAGTSMSFRNWNQGNDMVVTVNGAPTRMKVRVKVCDPAIGLESNCQQYGSSYKPVGEVQKNSETMRFGVTSYYNANEVDNAVLRSKAKFVGPITFSGVSASQANPYMEWSPVDGTLYRDPANCAYDTQSCTPDTATTQSPVRDAANPNSGVVNYINKFGNTAQSYKTYDVVGRLYYETLKYLRGGTPTTDFHNGANVANADGFPVITRWDDPLQTGWQCQKNFIMTMGDTHSWCDARLPGGTHGVAGNAVCAARVDANGNAHAADAGSLSGDSGINVTQSTGAVGNWEEMAGLATRRNAQMGSYHMAGLASWAASHDIRTGASSVAQGLTKKTVTSYVIDVQEFGDCGYQSQFWLAAKYGVPDAYDRDGVWRADSSLWSTSLALPSGSCSSGSPPLSDGKAVWPKQLLRANDPAAMIESVKSAFRSIDERQGTEAAMAQSSGSLSTGTGAYLYKASYNTFGWKGDVTAWAVDSAGLVSATPAWSASDRLPAPAERNIISWNPTTRTPFLFKNTSAGALPAGMSDAQRALLNTNYVGMVDGLGADRVNYLRGEQSKESPNANHRWRTRTSMTPTGKLLGDVMNSSPLLVGPPNFGYAFAGYGDFSRSQAARRKMLYVGANDGMLHAFDASFTVSAGVPAITAQSGKEVMAYVPSSVYANLSQLMYPNYTHRYYVDGSPINADICADACALSSDWKSILVGTLGAGGQGLFALDITDTSFAADKALWEFTAADDADLGYTFSKPVVRRLNEGKWYVIFGNGYNNTQADAHPSSSGRAYLYLLEANGPALVQDAGVMARSPWVLGSNYHKIELKSPSESAELATRLANPNGLSSVAAVDVHGDDKADYVYGGDRYGNLWKIDLTGNTPQSWKSAWESPGAPAVALPLFTATDANGARQQITKSVSVIAHPYGGLMIIFGTGSWLDGEDAQGPYTRDALYGIWDKQDGTRVTRSRLQQQKVLLLVRLDNAGVVNAAAPTCSAGEADCFAIVSNCAVNYTTSNELPTNRADPLCPASIARGDSQPQQLGWVLDLPGNGERTRSTAPFFNAMNVGFTTLTPSTDLCQGATIGMEYQISSLTGGQPAVPVYFTGSATGSTLLASLFPGATTGNVAGMTIPGGSSDVPARFGVSQPLIAPSPSGQIGARIPRLPLGVPGSPVACGNGYPTACADVQSNYYVPGWGFLKDLSDVAYLCVTYSAAGACQAYNYAVKPSARLTWKQIFR